MFTTGHNSTRTRNTKTKEENFFINAKHKHRHAKRAGVIFSIDWVAWAKTGC